MTVKPEILFLSPDHTTGNFSDYLGTAYIIAFLRQKGIHAKQFYSYKPSTIPQTVNRILGSGADIIGFSFYNANYFLIKTLCKELKKHKPDIFIIAGGPTPTFSDRIVLHNIPEIDICVRGEGEFTTKEVVEHFKRGLAFDNIAGISYRRNNKIMRNDDRPFMRHPASPENSLDVLPSPYLNNTTDPLHIIKHNKEIPLITSRGCIFKCTYCNCTSISKHTIRYHSPDRIIAELKLINDTIKEKDKHVVRIDDDCFTLNKKRVEKICNGLLENGIDLKIAITTRADYVDEKILKLLYNAGVRTISFGLESANPKTLYRINKIRLSDKKRKDFRLEKNFLYKLKKSVEIAKKTGFEVETSIILGLPGENLKDISRTIDFVEDLKIKLCYYNYLNIFPGTELFNNLEKDKKTVSEKYLQLASNRLPNAIATDQISRIPLLDNTNIAIKKKYNTSLSNAFLAGFLNKNEADKYAPAIFFLEGKAPVLSLTNKLPLQSLMFLARYKKKGIKMRHMRIAHAVNMFCGNNYIDYNMFGKYHRYHEKYSRWLNISKLSDAFSNKNIAGENIILDISSYNDIAYFERLLLNMSSFIHFIFESQAASFILLDACRWSNHCPAKDMNRLIVNNKLCMSPCFNGKIIGKLGDPFEKIENKYLNYLRLEEKKRGCGKCPARNQCSRCPFLGNIPYKTYCKIKRKYSARIDKLIALLNIKQYGRILTE